MTEASPVYHAITEGSGKCISECSSSSHRQGTGLATRFLGNPNIHVATIGNAVLDGLEQDSVVWHKLQSLE